jgi:shikimate dehydrogenase
LSELKKYGLIGKSLSYSFSKEYYKKNIANQNTDTRYDLIELPAITDLEPLLKDTSLKGFNITIPYKEAVLAYADELSDEVNAIGASNTFRRLHSGKWKAFNTDCYGFEKSIVPLIGQRKGALILGTGGAAKAVKYSLNLLGISTTLVSRKPEGKNQISYHDLNAKVLNEHLIIVNATPVGTFPNVTDFPPIPYNLLSAGHLLFDLVYNPEETAFLKKGKLAGCQQKNGLEMLHLQARKAWDIWNMPF